MDTTANEPLAADTESRARRSFLIMCICFGLNHAAVTTPIGYASASLGSDVGNASNAILYGVCMISALFLGPLMTSILGPKNALVGGMTFYVIYVLCFAAAAFFEPSSGGAWAFACIGAFLGGLGAGSLWTAQGAFFGAICEQIADATGTPLQSITAQLASTFAIWYLGQEAFWKSLFTVLSKYVLTGSSTSAILFTIYGLLALLSTVLMFVQPDLRSKTANASGPICARATSALKMWGDPKIWLLSGMNLTFGFAASYLNGYINSRWQLAALRSEDFIGFLGAIISIIAAVSSKGYSFAAEKMGTKMPIVVLGSACFLTMALLSFIQAPNGCPFGPDYVPITKPSTFVDTCEKHSGPGGWGWGIVVFYILQGMGRGVYESTNKGIFADFYTGETSIGAFANCIMQNTFSSTIGYAVGIAKPPEGSFVASHYGSYQYYLVFLLIPGALLTVPMLWLASTMKKPS